MLTGDDHTPARRDLAKTAVQAALRLQPDAGEPHLALAFYYYLCFRDYRTRSQRTRHRLAHTAERRRGF